MLLTQNRSAGIAKALLKTVEVGLKRKGVSARRASLDVVGHDGLIRDIRAGRIPSTDRVIALFEYLGVDHDALPLGFAEDPAPKYDDAPFVAVAFHPELPSPSAQPPIAFSREWLNEKATSLRDLALVTASDDAMSPTINAFNLVLIDKSQPLANHPEIMAVMDDNKFRIGRASRENGIVTLAFDRIGVSPIVRSGRAADAIRPLGRVIWVLKSL